LPSQPIAEASAFGPPVAEHGYGGLTLAEGAADAAAAAMVSPAAVVTAASMAAANRHHRRDRTKVALTELPPTLRCVIDPD
jgi:hypothetical protein